ncbi:glutamate--tRNA ligase [bacterium]|nr:glutamate--tRNA ligase [bacterium]
MENRSDRGSEATVRVRFAPSPTGHLHLGGARTALYNWLFARGNGGKFILRIEDTDVKRSEEGFMRQILADMRWLGLDWDEGPEKGGPFGPYFQSERTDIYRRLCETLIASDKAYYCFCKPEELEERRKEAEKAKAVFGYDGRCRNLSPDEVKKRLEAGEPAAVRFRVPDEGTTGFKDIIRKNVVVNNKELDDFIIVRSDGTPTYNFTVVADDLEMKISHVIRGDDHISNTPKQILIYRGLGKNPPFYAHIPMILGPDGTRLSKRHGATAIDSYHRMGYLPEAMVNYLTLLGWSFDDKQTLFRMDELVQKFSLKSVSKKAAIFDDQKLIWMNGTYIRDMDIDRLAALSRPYLEERFGGKFTDEPHLKKVLASVQPRLKIISDVTELTSYFWEDDVQYDPDAINKLTEDPKAVDILNALQERFSVLKFFTIEAMEQTCQELISELGVKFGVLVHPVRAAVTGRTAGPGLFETLDLLGREKVMKRIKKSIQFIEETRR